MEKTPLTSDFPLRPVGVGETLIQVFRSAAEQSAAGDELDEGSALESSAPVAERSSPRRFGQSALPSLQRRLYEADGRSVRLGRYDVLRCVGSGGMGVVYEATSVAHGQRVALKTLRWMTSTGLARFKNEFRSLCGVAHPNLVALYELGAEDGEWFFTMELVEGQSFLEHVQSGGERPLGGWEYLGETLDEPSPSGGDDATEGGDSRATQPGHDERGVGGRRGFHEGRLRAALRQLAGAVAAIHDLGKLHRDLNPGNVLVTREGRVVVLDFGLISDRVRRPGAPHDGASGTPAYMSPEQAAGKSATPASDWYGFGVMLFEALTGQLPFSGSTLRMLTNKRHHEAPPPSTLVAHLPRDLDELCAALLRRAPEGRPDAPAVLQMLGATPRRARPSAPWDDASFTGRSAELAALVAAQRAASAADPVAVVVLGPAGMGKSRLCARFLDQLGTSAVVLRGACGERETIPHRLLDTAVDALAFHLAALSPAEARSLLPPAARDLARIFPVLEGIDAIADLTLAPSDPDDAEASAFACLREILLRIATTRPVVLAIDDAHLGGLEGAQRLSALLAPPQAGERHGPGDAAGAAGDLPDGPARGLLLLITHASEELERSPVLAELSRVLVDLRRVVLGPLSADEARALARRAVPEDAVTVEAIVAASGGSPLAVEELALRFAEVGGAVSLDEAITARLAGLPERALRLLEIVATVAAPIERGLLFAVAGTGPGGDATLAWLTACRLLRVDGLGDGDRVRVHDDQLRTIVRSRTLPAVAQQIHLDLGRARAAR